MINVIGAKTKKSLKEMVGKRISVIDPSIVPEYKGTGSYTVVGPSNYNRKWYATIEVKDNVLLKVK